MQKDHAVHATSPSYIQRITCYTSLDVSSNRAGCPRNARECHNATQHKTRRKKNENATSWHHLEPTASKCDTQVPVKANREGVCIISSYAISRRG